MKVAQRFGYFTFLEACRDDEDLIARQKFRFFERKFEFFVAVSTLLIEVARQADDDHITFEQSFADLFLPILPRLESLRVKPDVQPVPAQTLIQLADNFPVTVRVDEEDVRLSC